MPDGNVICHKSATQTLIDTLIAIGTEHFEEIKTENCHLPLLSREIYPQYKDYMRPVKDGWYVNAQSDTSQKYMQLISIKHQLGIDMEVEIGTDFITSDKKGDKAFRKRDNKLLVKLPDGEFIAGDTLLDTLQEAVWHIDPEKIRRKDLEYKGKTIVTGYRKYNNQVQVGQNLWLTVPNTTKDKCVMLRTINDALRLGWEVTML